MLIGELADKANVSVDTIRYYQREGLIEPEHVRESGYREFDGAAEDRLRFITRAKKLGFSLKEIRDLLDLKNNPDTTCRDVKARAEQKLATVTRKIENLQEIRHEVEALVTACQGGDKNLDECPIMESLDGKENRK